MGILFGLSAALAWGTSDFLGGRFSTKYPVLTVGVVAQATGFVLLSIAALVIRPEVQGEAVAWGLAAGLFTSFGGMALYKGLATADSSVVAPLSACGAIVPVVFAFASGHAPSNVQSAGMVFAFAGALLCSLPAEGVHFGSSHHLRPVAYGLAAAAGFGLFFVFVDQGATTDEGSIVVIGAARFGDMVALGAAGFLAGNVRWPGSDTPKIVATGAIDVAANGLFALASVRGNVAVASVLASLYPLQTLVLSRMFTNERFTGLRILGAALALAGVAAISAG